MTKKGFYVISLHELLYEKKEHGLGEKKLGKRVPVWGSLFNKDKFGRLKFAHKLGVCVAENRIPKNTRPGPGPVRPKRVPHIGNIGM